MNWRKLDRKNAVILAVGGLILGLFVALTSPWKALALVVSLVVVLLSFLRPTWALAILALIIPLEPFILKFIPDDIYIYARYFSESLIYLLLAVAVVRRILKGKGLLRTPIDLPFAGFLLVALASLVVNAVPMGIGLLGLRQIIRFILLYYAAVWLEVDSAYIRRLMVMMFGVVVLECLLGIVQAATGGALDEFLLPSERRFFESIQLTSGTSQFWSPGSRIFATMGRYDQLGTFLCFFGLLAVGLSYEMMDRGRKRIYMALLLLIVPALLLTMSRASWFGFLGGLFVIGAIIQRDRRVRFAFAACVLALLAYWGWTGIAVRYLTEYPSQTPVERFFESFSYERWRGEYYGLGRLYWFVQTPLVVVRSSPVLGVGPGQFGGGAVAALGNTRVYEKLNLPFGVYGTDGYIDNNWFAIWGETGTLGLVFYAWMVLALAWTALRVWRDSMSDMTRGLALGFFGAVLAVGFQAFLATYLEVRTLALYLWLFGALIFTLARREKIAVSD
jgi:hypothetical protein